MCDICEQDKVRWRSAPNTEDRRTEVMEDLASKVFNHGHQVIGVGTEDPRERFWYSVGLSLENLPELLVTGPLPSQAGAIIINQCAEMLHNEFRLYDGYVFPPDSLLQDLPAKAIRCDPVASDMTAALALWPGADEDLEAYQLLWPDREGNFPGDPDYVQDECPQPVFAKVP